MCPAARDKKRGRDRVYSAAWRDNPANHAKIFAQVARRGLRRIGKRIMEAE